MKSFTLILLSAFIFVSSIAYAQKYETDKVDQQAISKLKFIVGEWSGTGWMMDRDGQKHSFDQTEKVAFKLDNTALLIEGLGKSDGNIIHQAMAVVRYNKEEKNFDFYSNLSNGHGGAFKAELIGDKFQWYPIENIRYTISLNNQGQWYEIGEMK